MGVQSPSPHHNQRQVTSATHACDFHKRATTGTYNCLGASLKNPKTESMVTPSLCQAAFAVFRQIEPIIVLEQLGSTLFDTALQMVVRDRCANITDSVHSREENQQRGITDFYMTYNLIIRILPIIPALVLARLSDRGWRKAPIVVPLSGYLLSRLALLLVVIFGLPLEVMFAAAVVFGLSGGFSAYWPGVMTLASLGSSAANRSQ
ncbi:hypothetical protein XENOCAPTIV_008550, partial [Xenoophorus captivus]